MKTLIKIQLAVLLVVATVSQAYSQHVTGGVSAAASFNSVELENAANHLTKKDNIIGAEVGIFLHAPMGAFYLMPSVNASFLRGTISAYTDEAGEVQSDFRLNTVEVPVLAGLQFLPFFSVEAGPSWSYIVSWSEKVHGTTVDINRHSLGYRAGVRFTFSSVGIFGHYGGMLNTNDGDKYHLSRPSRIMVGLSINLGNK